MVLEHCLVGTLVSNSVSVDLLAILATFATFATLFGVHQLALVVVIEVSFATSALRRRLLVSAEISSTWGF